jgi:hypothetical protein
VGEGPSDAFTSEELGDLRRAHVDWMSLAVEEDVSTDPRDVRLLGAATVVAGAQGSANTVEETRL